MAGTTSPLPRVPEIGDEIGGKYLIERLLGRGGMGAVYAARHKKLGHVVAIKVLTAETDGTSERERFVREGMLAVTIESDHVVRVSDVDDEDGYAYMVLEYLEGEDLERFAQRSGGRLSPHLAVEYVSQALEGVAAAHALGIVHRDLKPANLYRVKRKDGGALIKILDFGISKPASTSPLNQSPSTLTSTKAMLGSPLYMSPEQLRSARTVDHRTDIWATGVILFELVTGALPFNGETLGELFAAVLENDPPSARSLCESVPPELDAIIARCLRRRPEDRFQSAEELLAALAPLRAACGDGARAPSDPGPISRPATFLAAPQSAGVATQPHTQTHGGWQSPGAGPLRGRTTRARVAIAAAALLTLGGAGALVSLDATPPSPSPAASVSSPSAEDPTPPRRGEDPPSAPTAPAPTAHVAPHVLSALDGASEQAAMAPPVATESTPSRPRREDRPRKRAPSAEPAPETRAAGSATVDSLEKGSRR